jgi:hypothetical protein
VTKDHTLEGLEQQVSSWQYRDASTITPAELKQLKPGKIAITIHSDGSWSYKGSMFDRPSMVVLLAKSLIYIDQRYYLIAPEQLLEISVEDLPFTIVSVERGVESGSENRAITLCNNLGERFELGKSPSGNSEQLLELDGDSWGLSPLPGEDLEIPYVALYRGLKARLSRSCFYQLVEWGEPVEIEGRSAMCVFSNGVSYMLGYVD